MKLTFAALLLNTIGLALSTPVRRTAKPPSFFLIGDSTVAVDGGWGDGFLSYLKAPAEGSNRGVSGSTTVSWKSNGRWGTLIQDIGAAKAEYEPVVTIQFGHNDQKVMALDEFHANLVDIGNAIKEAGGVPYYNWGQGDRTHLNPAGEVVFGRMVLDLLLEKREDFLPYFTSNQALTDKILKGEFATGEE
ncbi:hypothetical protein FGRMN_2984 [Fusarium graminum]|nr:hypothetical protein FGRMN_2984 [Fusarium graminum]